MSKTLAMPGEDGWCEPLTVPAVDATMYDGAHIVIPEHTIQVPVRFPTYADGETIAYLTQRGMAELLRGYPELRGGLTLYETLLLCGKLGKEDPAFDETFNRGVPHYNERVLDFSRPCDYGMVDGVEVNGQRQMLVTRLIGYRLSDGDEILGVTTIAPSGMVPTLTKAELEKHRVNLTELGKLGVELPESGGEIVNLTDALGYPKLTLPHGYEIDGNLVPHSHHVWTPEQTDDERVGVLDAFYHLLDGDLCFITNLGFAHGLSDTSFSLVRREKVKFSVERPAYL